MKIGKKGKTRPLLYFTLLFLLPFTKFPTQTHVLFFLLEEEDSFSITFHQKLLLLDDDDDDGNNAALCLGGRERASEHGASAEQTATTDHRPATVTGRLRVPRTEGNAITHATAPPTTTTAATSSRSTTRSTTRRAVSTTTARTDGPTNPPTATDG